MNAKRVERDNVAEKAGSERVRLRPVMHSGGERRFNTQYADPMGRTCLLCLLCGPDRHGVSAIRLTAFLELTRPGRQRLDVEFNVAAQPRIDAFLVALASRLRWNGASRERLRAAGEETLLSLLERTDGEDSAGGKRRLIVLGRPDVGVVELEFLAVLEDKNLEDRIAYMKEEVETLDETDVSVGLLRHYATSVRHRKYHGQSLPAARGSSLVQETLRRMELGLLPVYPIPRGREPPSKEWNGARPITSPECGTSLTIYDGANYRAISLELSWEDSSMTSIHWYRENHNREESEGRGSDPSVLTISAHALSQTFPVSGGRLSDEHARLQVTIVGETATAKYPSGTGPGNEDRPDAAERHEQRVSPPDGAGGERRRQTTGICRLSPRIYGVAGAEAPLG